MGDKVGLNMCVDDGVSSVGDRCIKLWVLMET